MTTPAAEAIKGLVEAHEMNTCDESDCGQEQCMRSRAALDAWEKRRPLREDAELIDAVAAKLADEFGETTWNIDPDDVAGYVRITRVLLDALDAALFGGDPEEGEGR